jgi:pimeloyl-ACP methyl ester carboxylesterase
MSIKLIACLFFFLVCVQPVFSQADSTATFDINLSSYPYPFPVKYLSLEVQNQQLQMAYMDVMPGRPNGNAVMLLHGKNFNGAYWRSTASALVEHGYRVIIPDQIGFGKSTKPPFFQYSFQQLAANTKTLLDSLKITKATVVGHSMGGMLATRFALMYPSMVSKLVLVDPIGLEDWKLKVPYKPVEWWYQRELKSNEKSIKKYQQENYYHGTWKAEYEEWVKPLAGITKSPDYSIAAWNSALTYDMIFTQPVLYEFDKLTCPVLLIIGQMDRTAIGKDLVPDSIAGTMGNYPALGKIAQQKIKGSTLVELENTGHLPHVESFEKFINTLTLFLKTP